MKPIRQSQLLDIFNCWDTWELQRLRDPLIKEDVIALEIQWRSYNYDFHLAESEPF